MALKKYENEIKLNYNLINKYLDENKFSLKILDVYQTSAKKRKVSIKNHDGSGSIFIVILKPLNYTTDEFKNKSIAFSMETDFWSGDLEKKSHIFIIKDEEIERIQVRKELDKDIQKHFNNYNSRDEEFLSFNSKIKNIYIELERILENIPMTNYMNNLEGVVVTINAYNSLHNSKKRKKKVKSVLNG